MPDRFSQAERRKVLIIVGDAAETLDTLYPFLRVQEEGFIPVVAAPERRVYQMVLHERPASGWDITREYEGYTIGADIAFDEVNPAEYVGLFLSGGRAPEYIRDHPALIELTRYFFRHRKPVASVCHGVEIPCRAGVVAGRRMTTVAKCRFDLEVCGGVYVDAPCVVDDHLVSGRTWHDHGQYMGHFMQLLRAERERMNQGLHSEGLRQ